MHMRKKKWAQGELDACPFYYENAYEHRGRWRRDKEEHHGAEAET